MSDRGAQPRERAQLARRDAVAGREPFAVLPELAALPEPEPPWWLEDDFYPGDVLDEAAFLAGLPEDVRVAYLSETPGECPPGQCPPDELRPGEWDACEPGWRLGRALADQRGRFSQLSDADLVGALDASHRQVSHAQAQRARILSAFARRREEQDRLDGERHPGEFTGDELAIALHLTKWAAGGLLRQAAGLDRFGELLRFLEGGFIDYPKAGIFTDGLADLPDVTAARIVAELLDDAATMTTAQLREALRAAILAADPDAAERRRDDARKDARVEMWDEPSGNKAIAARELSPADAIVIDTQITAHAEYLQSLGAPGSISELRAMVHNGLLSGRDPAALIAGWEPPLPTSCGAELEAACGQPKPADERNDAEHDAAGSVWSNESGAGSGPTANGSSPGAGWPLLSGTIHLTMPLATFDGSSQRPGEAAAYGPLDADTCRDVAAAMRGAVTKWCLTLTDSRGRAIAHTCARAGPAPGQAPQWAARLRNKMQHLEAGPCRHGRDSPCYRPPVSLVHLVRVRQRTCAAPGCGRSAMRCDLDHTIPYREGGRTDQCNLAPLCRRHHRCKHAPRWALAQDQPGWMIWTLPHRRTYETAGKSYPV
ncbi:MAG TPA: HNH endonuclease [Streptosporangiaceae bacterium]